MAYIIGISGNARTGKDTFAERLKQHINESGKTAKIYSFAYNLKEYLNNRLPELGLDFHNLGEHKEMARPIMIHCAHFLREKTQGRYFVDLLAKEIESENYDYAIISDYRFMEYDYDEYSIIKFSIFLHRDGVNPAHEIERKNNEIIKSNANFIADLTRTPLSDPSYLRQISGAFQMIKHDNSL